MGAYYKTSFIPKVLNELLYLCHQTQNVLKSRRPKEDSYIFTTPNYYYDCFGNFSFDYSSKVTYGFHYLLLIPRELMLQGHMVPELGLHTSHVLSNIICNIFGLLLEEEITEIFITFYFQANRTVSPLQGFFCSASQYCMVRDVLSYSIMGG